MVRHSAVLAILAVALLVSGCSPFMVQVREVDTTHYISGTHTKEQVRDAIMRGAQAAGWRAKDWEGDKILATYTYTQHTVHVEIDYTESTYVTRYHSSNQMKMFCTEEDQKQHRAMLVSGRHTCPGNSPPAYIHKSYQEWTANLNRSIQRALASS